MRPETLPPSFRTRTSAKRLPERSRTHAKARTAFTMIFSGSSLRKIFMNSTDGEGSWLRSSAIFNAIFARGWGGGATGAAPGSCPGTDPLAPAEGGDDVDLVGLGDGLSQRPGDLPVDVEQEGRTDAALLVDHPEAESGIAPVQILQDRLEGRALRLDLAAVVRIGVERRRDVDDRHPLALVSIEQTCGRCEAMHSHRAPSFRLAQSSPLVVPKYKPTGVPASAANACRFTVSHAWDRGRPLSCRVQDFPAFRVT